MKFFNKNSKLISIATFVALFFVIFAVSPVSAGWKEVVALPFTWMFAIMVYAIGFILMVLIYLVIWVAQYNDFINASAVTTGWVIVRDLCNMFFILILLVIAFATTLNRESYSMKRLLPKFILAAIFINFSKLICGVIIDFAQVIMLTFVNGFRDIGPGNLTAMLGTNNLLNITSTTPENATVLSIISSYVLAFLYVIIATVVIVVILFILIMRIVMLWIYIVLSPLAYLLMVLPATEKYSKQWWDQFIQNVVAGPVLAFFIWLSFAAVSITSTGSSILGNTPQPNQTANESAAFGQLSAPQAGLSGIGTPDQMLKFVIAIGMLMGGLMVTKQIGGIAGSIAGGGITKLKDMGKWAGSPVTDRWRAFQSERQAARKEKIGQFGERMFSRYNTAKSGIQGGIKTTVSRGADTLAKATHTQGLREKVGNLASNVKDTVTFKKYREATEERNKVKNERRKAYLEQQSNGPEANVYKDNVGNKYSVVDVEYGKPDKKTGKRKVAQYYGRKDEVTGETIYAKDHNGTYIKPMTDREFKTDQQWTRSMYEAKSYSNRKDSQQAIEQEKKMLDAGLSKEQMLGVLQNKDSSSTQRIASALALAVKEGFKDHEQAAIADKTLGQANNSILSKQFNDDIDKKQAYLHYDVKTDAGRKKFEDRLLDGKIDIQKAEAYKDKNIDRAYSNVLTGKEYVRRMQQVSSASKEHDDNRTIGHNAFLDEQKPVFDDNNEVVVARYVDGKIGNADLHNVLRGNDGKGLDVNEFKSVIPGVLDKLSLAEIAKLSGDTFNFEKTDAFSKNTPENIEAQKREYQKVIRDTFKSMGIDKLHKIIINNNGNRKFQGHLETIREELRAAEAKKNNKSASSGAGSNSNTNVSDDDQDDENREGTSE